MSDVKHTKGPWIVVEHSWAETSILEGDNVVCTLSIEGEATEETQDALERRAAERARLIAAAPNLSALAKRVLSEGSSDLSKLSADSLRCLLESLADDAREILAKAEGK